MRLPRLGLIFYCQAALYLIADVEAEQCRLRAPNNVFGGIPSSSSSVQSPTDSSVPAAPGSNSDTGPLIPFKYGVDPIRGVNLGGWLVLEPWITPSIFENTNNNAIVDEFTLGSLLDSQTASRILINHWKTWITEADFVAIKAAGLNHVRIPLGYWSVPLTTSNTNTSASVAPYVPGAWTYLLRGLNWARKHSIHVIIDIHGAPGSQNGYDNSGQLTSNPQWAQDPANVRRTIDTLRFIAENIGGMIDVLELLNEPAGFRGQDFVQTVRQFWLDGYNAVRDAVGGGMKIMIGDAFLGFQSWTNFLNYPSAQGVLMDIHQYQIFSDLELNRTFDEHVAFACTMKNGLSSFASSNIWTVMGEWSNAPTDCAKWLNGRGVGSRWDGTWFPGPNTQYHGSCTNYTGNSAGFSSSYMAFLRRYWEVQVEIGENIQGWVFWTWKAENADEWSYQKGLEGGWIPQDPTDRVYPRICS